jgi:hypothetical protein
MSRLEIVVGASCGLPTLPLLRLSLGTQISTPNARRFRYSRPEGSPAPETNEFDVVRNLDEFEGKDICISNPEGNYAIPSNSQGLPDIITTTAYVGPILALS